MAFVKILAPLTGGTHDREVLTGAISAALPFGAHVAALFVRPDPALAMPFYGEGMSGIVVQEVMDASKGTADAAALLDHGIERVVLGSAALETPELVETLAHWLRTLTGMPAVALSPAARAQWLAGI